MAEPTKAAEWYRWLKLLVERADQTGLGDGHWIIRLEAEEFERLKRLVGR